MTLCRLKTFQRGTNSGNFKRFKICIFPNVFLLYNSYIINFLITDVAKSQEGDKCWHFKTKNKQSKFREPTAQEWIKRYIAFSKLNSVNKRGLIKTYD